ncbi:anthranilate synthase component 2 [Polymorphobacter multimanifer]|uniref:Anthranilate synthase component 2 n=1 Tax=Polymorphobacter multimanifer TaxID=1070431 RepID=A0A841LAZ8_9SPHN|nr:aminodeoxychorismate/anthranilate synthase component II [Polymorphobacter multimanifer]MBB6228831.1 anthranilate synthase component 2 [Polymorphobacter multimanifer]
MILVIDNYDSFTFNLVHYLEELGAPTHVVRNDAITVADAMALRPAAILLSPGPCTPNEAGICLGLIAAAAQARLPLLGVCLGHQALGQAFGGRVIRAPRVMHGKTSDIAHTGTGVFAGLPSPYLATRYHSLIVEAETLPTCFTVNARADGLIMGMHHKTLPLHGVQFHPESIATEHGHALLANFLDSAGIAHSAVPA